MLEHRATDVGVRSSGWQKGEVLTRVEEDFVFQGLGEFIETLTTRGEGGIGVIIMSKRQITVVQSSSQVALKLLPSSSFV